MSARRGAFVPAFGRELGVREACRELPNFRDHGRTVDTALLRLVGRLQVRFGRAFASERALRAMLHEDTGLMAGVTTIPKALVRLGKQGLVVNVPLVKGQVLPDGSTSTSGTRLVWCPQNRRQKFAAKRFNRDQDRRQGERNRCVPAAMAGELLAKAAASAAIPDARKRQQPDERELAAAKAFEDKRAEDMRRLAELEAQWKREGKPPD